jgi:hypothetical protein
MGFTNLVQVYSTMSTFHIRGFIQQVSRAEKLHVICLGAALSADNLGIVGHAYYALFHFMRLEIAYMLFMGFYFAVHISSL